MNCASPVATCVHQDSLYHLSLYACYDKKLEASRNDFKIGETRETDCVLSSSEILEVLSKEGLEWDDIPLGPINEAAQVYLSREMAHWDADSEFEASGGYLEFVMRYAAQELFGHSIHGPLQYKQRRNPNWQEVFLELNGEKVCAFPDDFKHQLQTKTGTSTVLSCCTAGAAR